MIVRDKKHFRLGVFLTLGFFIILALMFMPLYGGVNAFHASDNLFNSISKDSTYKIPGLLDELDSRQAQEVDLALKFKNADKAEYAATIAQKSGFSAAKEGNTIQFKAKLNSLVTEVLEDSDNMFHNKGSVVQNKYQMDPEKALYGWWLLFKAMETELKVQKEFSTAKFVNAVITQGIEVGYNFYGIDSTPATSRAGILIFALVFYVVYTIWWGFAIFYVFEGLGLAMTKGKRKEV